MSLILEALRKSDRQRQHAAADRLREGPRPQAHATARWLTLTSALLALVSLAAFIAFAVQPGQEAREKKPVSDDAPILIMENKPAPPATVRGLRSELARKPQPAPSVAAAAEADSSPAAMEEPASTRSDAPSLAELPDVRDAGLPALHVDVHAWAERPADRFVLINLRRYGEGDRLDEGAVIHHIVPDGVVLEYRGELYSLPRR